MFERESAVKGSGAGTGGAGWAAAPRALLPRGATGAVLPFAFQYDSNEAKRLLCNL